ncbi:TPA: hypothetical protein JLN09_004373 [Escherichia coli]|uniref:hypothetical protein n=2 Tax=Escherichia coli TaxID=562 RepID=UPI0002C927DD|nr:hypothetical protein [Escherichia coli]DAG41367.1 MAG TPA: hypothetical protein [Caudoviricetes sp.]ENE21483.1 hypothetical protein ECP03047993_5436 [Escherichia coli P0304799.3]HAW7887965.1 hypothetical protein [Escherichia coli]HBA6250001.1 hypothetical protein [Escherichia coli]HCN5515252.1 hypothetical protein [Escherichia coli]
MQKPEPVIIAPGYTDDEIYEWMIKKVKAVQDLKWACDSRELQVKNLSELDKEIAGLTEAASLNVAKVAAHLRQYQANEINDGRDRT